AEPAAAVGGLGCRDQVEESLAAGRVPPLATALVPAGLAAPRPRAPHLPAPSGFSWKIATVFGRSPAGMSASRPWVCLPMSGDFQNGENRYLKPCWWIRWSANAMPRYGVLFFSATDAAAAWRSEPKPPRYATTPCEASVSSRATVLVASDSSSRTTSSSGCFLPPTVTPPAALTCSA